MACFNVLNLLSSPTLSQSYINRKLCYATCAGLLKCLNLTNAEYKLFNKRSDLHWYCPPCEEKTMKNIKIEKEIEDRCKEFFSKYENRLEALESEVRKKVDMSTGKDMIDESILGKLKRGE